MYFSIYIASKNFSVTMSDSSQEENMNQRKFDGTLLIDAIDREHLEDVKFLINSSSSVNQRADDGSTPLQVAIHHSNLEIVHLLLSKEADPNLSYTLEDEDDPSFLFEPLLHALAMGKCDIALALIKAGAKLNIKNDEGESPLHMAIMCSSESLVEEMIQRNISVNEKDNIGQTPCMLAAEFGSTNILKMLLNSNAKINDQDSSGCTALIMAIRSFLRDDTSEYDTQCIHLLIENNADVNLVDKNKCNVLMQYLIRWEEPDKQPILNLLINAGCQLDTKEKNGYNVLHLATNCWSTFLVQTFINHGVDVNEVTGDNHTPLYVLANDWAYNKDKSIEVAKCLLNNGANPNATHPLSVAAAYNRIKLVEILLQCGADINDVHPNYGTVLFNAGVVGNHAMVKLALSYKAKVNIANIPEADFPEHPEHSDKYALMLMFAAGELYPFFESSDPCVPTTIIRAQNDHSLKNHCRRVIRNQIIMTNKHENLFEATPKLGLPALMQKYIVHEISLSEGKKEYFESVEEKEEYDEEDTRPCVYEIAIRWMSH